MAAVTVLVGPALSGKTSQLLARYRTALAQRQIGATLWLAPTQRSAFDIRGRLLDEKLDACFTPGVMTFAQFAEAVLQASALPARPVTPSMKRHLVRRMIDAAAAEGRLQYFAPIAETPGLVALVGQWIGELKRLEIWPEEFRAACQKRGLLPKDSELLALYEAYQQALTRHDLYDAEGRFWWARQLLRDGQRRPFEHVRLAIVDGFTDFTRTQHEILEVLAERVETLLISLPLEQDSRRPDLFAKTQETLDALIKRHPQLAVEWLPRPEKPAWPALAHLERQLFKNPREAEAAPDAEHLHIVAASRDDGEIVHVGRRIKQLLTRGDRGRPVKPGDVAVVFRRLAESASLVQEVFQELGLPTAIESGESLDFSPALAALVSLLELDREDWPFRRLLAVLGSSYFRPAWPEWDHGRRLAVVERVIRELQIPQGRAEVLRRIEWLATTPIDAEATGDHDRHDRRQQRQQEAELTLPVLARLAACFDRLPTQATPSQWVAALTTLAEETGFLKVIATPPDAARPSNEEPAWDRLRQSLHAAEQMAGWLEEPPPQWGRRDLLDAVLDVLRCEQLPAPHDETGRVRVLSAASIRTLSVPYLFFAGLSETAMPGSDREDRLYSDAEYQQLHGLGLPLILRSQRNQEEMLLFYEVCTRATQRLQPSYPALDEKAQPLLPSPYVSELQRAIGASLAVEEATDLNPVPQIADPQSSGDLRLLSVARALKGDAKLFAALVRRPPSPQVGQQMLAALRMAGERAQRASFGPFEGMLASTAAKERLAARFGPQLAFSPSHLEQYARCPYQFFLARVLRLRDLPDVGLEIDFAQRGWRLHNVLATLHRAINADEGGPYSPARLEPPDFQQQYQQALDQLFTLAEDQQSLEQAMAEIDRATLDLWLARYQDQHRSYDQSGQGVEQPPAPGYFEVSFGLPLAGEVDPISREEPLEIDAGGVKVKLAGRIDRIDVGQAGGQAIFNIIDYKSGRPRSPAKDQPLDGTSLQLELYAIAAQDMLLAKEGAIPWEAGYWHLREKKGYRAWFELHEGGRGKVFVDWEARRREALAKLAELVAGIRAAQFPVHSLDEQCTGFCPFSTVCRVNQVRSLEKARP